MYDFNKSTGIISFINRKEETDTQMISSVFATFDEKKIEYIISDNKKDYEDKIGALLFEFLYTNFVIFPNFLDFFNKYMEGFISYFDEKTLNYFSNNNIMDARDYLDIVERIYDRSINDIIDIQKQAREVLKLCIEKDEEKDIRWEMIGPYTKLSIMSTSTEHLKKYPFLCDSLEYVKHYFLSYEDSENGIIPKWVEGSSKLLETHPQVSYHCKNIIYLIPTFLFQLFWYKTNIVKCETCGRYFLSDSKKAKYCNYPSLDNFNKTCNVVSREMVYKTTMKNYPLEKDYRRLYQKLEKFASRHLDYKDFFEKFKIEGRSKKQDWKKGKLSDEEFERWISEQNS